MSEGTTWVGMDVHQERIVVAMLSGWDKQPRELQVLNRASGIKKLVRTLKQQGKLESAYEAGPCGFDLQRRLQAQGIRCTVIAPSLTLVKAGERIKTDRRDAHKHRRWLLALEWQHEADRVVFGDYLQALEQLEERMKGLGAALEQEAGKEPYRQPVGYLKCFRGFDTVNAMTVVAELFQVARFSSPRQLTSYLGLVPSEHSSGSSRRQVAQAQTRSAGSDRVAGGPGAAPTPSPLHATGAGSRQMLSEGGGGGGPGADGLRLGSPGGVPAAAQPAVAQHRDFDPIRGQ